MKKFLFILFLPIICFGQFNPIFFYRASVGKSFPIQSEYQAVLDRAIALGYTLPSKEQQRLDNNVVYYLKLEGIWNDIELLYMFKSDASDFTKINWKNPSSYLLTSSSPPSFETKAGWSCGTNTYWDTNYIPSTNAVKCLVNDCSVFYKNYGTGTVASIFGTRNNSGNNFWASNPGTLLHSNTISMPYALDNASILSVKNGTTMNHYENGVFGTSFTYTSSSLSSVSLSIFALNNNGTIQNFNTSGSVKLSYFGLGSKNIEAKQLELYKILNNLY